MRITVMVLVGLLALAYVYFGLTKIFPKPAVVDMAGHLGHTMVTYRLIGVCEVAGAAGLIIGLWLPPFGIAASTGLVVLMSGAAVTHSHVDDPFQYMVPCLVLGSLALVTLVLFLLTSL